MNTLQKVFGDKLKLEEPFNNHTTLQIGGPAKYFLEVSKTDELIRAIAAARSDKVNYLVIGGGSNLLVADEGFPGLVIKNNCTGSTVNSQVITVHSGTTLQQLVDITVKEGLSGMEKLTGIPGSVGGAVFGNAGAFGQQISDYLSEVECFDPVNGVVVRLKKAECRFGYRSSVFKKNRLIVLAATFKLPRGKAETLQQEAGEVYAKRQKKYPADLKCPGSFFKNIPVASQSPVTLRLIPSEKIIFDKLPAGFLLESVGAKGYQVGRIRVSEEHGNLFINLGQGTAEDFWQLAKTLAVKVKDKYGIRLQPEVQLVNLPPL